MLKKSLNKTRFQLRDAGAGFLSPFDYVVAGAQHSNAIHPVTDYAAIF